MNTVMGSSDALPDEHARRDALDVSRSFIVQAPAGSGKTTLLAQRFLHLLEIVRKPEEVLAITFTRKAAAEMRTRVLDLLQDDTAVAQRVRQRDIDLGWNLAANPNQLKIQTIDSFAYDVTSQALGASNAGSLNLIEDAFDQYERAAEHLLARLYDDDPLNGFIAEFLAFLDNNATQAVRLVSQMLAKRDQWWDAATSLMAHSQDSDHMHELLRTAINELSSSFETRVAQQLNDADWNHVDRLAELIGSEPNLRRTLPLLFTKAGSLRKRLTAKDHVAFSDAEIRRELVAWLESLRDRELEAPLDALLQLPDGDLHPTQARILTVCCTCLALAAVELDRVFAQDELLDFTGLLMRARQGLREDDAPTDLALQWDYRINHVLVDEFQDTSRSQFDLFRLLTEGWQAGDGRSLFAVGDPMQSIYRFRDADVSIFMDCKDNGLHQIVLQPIQLEANFRSAPTLVRWCNILFTEIFRAGKLAQIGTVEHTPATAIQPESDESQVICRRYESNTAEIEAVIQHIESLLEGASARQMQPSIAILCRARSHLDQLIQALRRRNIEWEATDIDPLNEEPVVLDLMSLYEVLISPKSRLAWFALLRSPLFGLPLKELDKLQDVTDLAAYIDQAPHLPSPLIRLKESLQWARPRMYEVPLREVVEGMWIRLGGIDAYSGDAVERAIFWLQLLEQLGDRAYESSTVHRAINGLYANPTSNNLRTGHAIQIMTIHKSKGLEFDHVLVPFLDRRTRSDKSALLLWEPTHDGLLMGIKDDSVHDWLRFQNKSRDDNEQKRLLYVAFTRARSSLFASFTDTGANTKVTGLARHLADYAESPPTDTSYVAGTIDPVVSNPLQGHLFQDRSYERLPLGHIWEAPKYPSIPAAHSTMPRHDPIGTRFEVNVGTVVHQALAWLADHTDHSSARVRACVENSARSSMVPPEEETALVHSALHHIDNVLADPDGLWLLKAHAEHAAELELTGVVDDQIYHHVLDRTFVVDGVRWIIDYKTDHLSGDVDDFVHTQTSRYAAQLQRYAQLALAVFAEPVQTALYFTAIPKLQPLELLE